MHPYDEFQSFFVNKGNKNEESGNLGKRQTDLLPVLFITYKIVVFSQKIKLCIFIQMSSAVKKLFLKMPPLTDKGFMMLRFQSEVRNCLVT